jgi:hypothetical protein
MQTLRLKVASIGGLNRRRSSLVLWLLFAASSQIISCSNCDGKYGDVWLPVDSESTGDRDTGDSSVSERACPEGFELISLKKSRHYSDWSDRTSTTWTETYYCVEEC